MKISKMDMSPMLNAYPDSVENNIEGMLGFLQKEEAQDIFGSTGYFWKLLYFAKYI